MKTRPTPKSEFLAAAQRQFAQHGFAATTTRNIMDDLGLSPAALYYYFSSKTDLLYEVLLANYQPMLAGLQEVLENTVHESADVRLAAAIRYTTPLYVNKEREIALIESDRRFLEPERQQRVLSILRAYHSYIKQLVVDGQNAGLWPPIDVSMFTNTLFGMMACRWYRPRGPKTPEEIADVIVQWAFRVLQCPAPADRTPLASAVRRAPGSVAADGASVR